VDRSAAAGSGGVQQHVDAPEALRDLFDRRIFPSIDISQSGTRKEEKLYSPTEYQKVVLLRRALAPLRPAEAMQLLVSRLAKTKSNTEFLTGLSGAS
jgi:transcription termination factor Rho